MNNGSVSKNVKKLLDKQIFSVLCSLMDKQPYSDIMAFMPYDNYRSIIFITARATRKYSNLKKHPECSMFIDDRRNKTSDCLKAHGVNASGKAYELKPGLESAQIAQMFVKRHPAMEDFIKSPTVALFRLEVATYYFVENFQEVTEIHLDQ